MSRRDDPCDPSYGKNNIALLFREIKHCFDILHVPTKEIGFRDSNGVNAFALLREKSIPGGKWQLILSYSLERKNEHDDDGPSFVLAMTYTCGREVAPHIALKATLLDDGQLHWNATLREWVYGDDAIEILWRAAFSISIEQRCILDLDPYYRTLFLRACAAILE